MKAVVLDSQHPDKIRLTDMNLPALGVNEAKIKIHAAALNHRDQWCREGKYPNLKDGVVLGSDGAGVVEAVGDEVDSSWIGKEVIINPAIHWGNNSGVQDRNFRILGMPDYGTFAEYLHVDVDRLHTKPEHLDFERAAALPLAGLTAYRALVYHGKVKKGDKVLITGYGGGVAQMAVQFAVAMGAEVYVNSGEKSKIDKALAMGVKAGFDYQEASWPKQALDMSGGFDLIVDSAMGDTFSNLLDVVRPGGSIVFYGATLGNPSQLNARKVFWNQIRIQGSTMGSDQDFSDMLLFVNGKKIVPDRQCQPP
jgi:NADPH:quinone reductase-like Zn-dependent oxidoreductase